MVAVLAVDRVIAVVVPGRVSLVGMFPGEGRTGAARDAMVVAAGVDAEVRVYLPVRCRDRQRPRIGAALRASEIIGDDRNRIRRLLLLRVEDGVDPLADRQRRHPHPRRGTAPSHPHQCDGAGHYEKQGT